MWKNYYYNKKFLKELRKTIAYAYECILEFIMHSKTECVRERERNTLVMSILIYASFILIYKKTKIFLNINFELQ